MQIRAISSAVQYFLSRIFWQTDSEEKVFSKEKKSHCPFNYISLTFLSKSVGFSYKRIKFSKPGEEHNTPSCKKELLFTMMVKKIRQQENLIAATDSSQKASSTKLTSLFLQQYPTLSVLFYRDVNWQSLLWSFTQFLPSGRLRKGTQLFINDKLDPNNNNKKIQTENFRFVRVCHANHCQLKGCTNSTAKSTQQ